MSGSEDQTIKVWSVPSDIPTKDGQPMIQLKVKFAEKAHDKVSEDQTIKVWSIPSVIPTESGQPMSQLKVKFAEKAHNKVSCSEDHPRTSTPIKGSTHQPRFQSKNRRHRLKAMVVNCNGIKGSDKQAAFQALIAHHDPDVIMGCETKIAGSVATYSVFPENYNILRKDRNLHGGGTFLAFKDTLIATEMPELDTNSEIIWANLHFANSKSLYLASFYRPPNADFSSVEDLSQSIQKILAKHPRQHVNITVGGDFNFGDINWDEWKATVPRTKAIHEKFLQFLLDNSLAQLVRKITRPVSKKILDLIVTSNPNLIT